MSNNRPWHTLTAEDVSGDFGVDVKSGLDEDEASRRLAQFGLNRLRQEEREPIWEIILEELREPMIALLLITGALYAFFGELADAVTIFAVISIVVGVEIFNERRAERAIAALHKLAEPTVLVRRDGQHREVPVEEIVPGDLILLEAGRRIPADARLIESYGLAVDESSLTGESVPVMKEVDLRLAEGTPLAERRNLIFAGSAITRGRGAAVVTATGMATELGRVAGLTREIEEPGAPLQQTMRELTRWMVWLALGFSVTAPLLGWLRGGGSPQQMLLTGLSLAFATIPEELPILITLTLALGAYRLSQRQAIVKRLRAAETLSAVTVIATDKTGTLTENRMRVSRYYPAGVENELLRAGVLCNDAITNNGQFIGDPMEVALLKAAHDAWLDADKARQAYPLRNEFTFDNARKMMSVVYERDGAIWSAVKGSPEAVLARSTRQTDGEVRGSLTDFKREIILTAAARMAGEGLRVLAFAEKVIQSEAISQEEAESDLCFIGLAGLADPPRPEVAESIAACQATGIRLAMITGDHPLTAESIADQVGLNRIARTLTGPELDALSDEELRDAAGQVSVYARTTPEHKLRIVRALRERGEIVAVTGDGINDAPALAAADIGVAMGETGTDVAREAADIVLADDNFATIVAAVKEGRLLFANLRKAARYYLACKVALISATLLPVLLQAPVPFSPVQIILMELFMDLAASVTFMAERAESDLMRHPPRDLQTPFMNRAMVTSIFGSAAGLFTAVTIVYLITWYSGAGLPKAQTMAFGAWMLGHVFLAANLRSEREPLLQLGLFSNRLMVVWGVATLAFVLVATLMPTAQRAFKTVALSGREWAIVVSAAALNTFWIEAGKWFLQKGRIDR